MKERIDIIVPDEILALNDEKRLRLERTHRFEQTDRAPVVVDMQLWGLLAGWGGSYGEMRRSPRHHLRGQILNWKYRYEHIHDDLPIDTQRLVVELDFGAIRGVEFPLEVVFHDDDQPKTIHMLKAPEEIDGLEIPHPYNGHNKLRIDWFLEMRQMVDDFDVRLNGEPLALEVTLNHWGGPIPSAFALCGSNLFLWIATDPERVTRLMEIVTQSHLNCIAYLDDLKGVDHRHPIWLGADTGEMMRAAHFKEFVAPYYRRIYEQYPRPRTYHMCGKINHILEIIRDEMQVDYLDGFGFPTDPQRLAEALSGRVVLRGGLHPVLLHDGPVDAILEAGRRYIHGVGRRGGYILSEGFGVMTGTPPAHIETLVEASRRAGWVGAG